MPESFADRLAAAVRSRRNPTVVGLDPHLDLLPEEYAAARDPRVPRAERAEAVCEFLLEVVRLVAPHVPAVKPQSAFFEALGADGAVAWERVVRASREAGLLVIGDVKRGDIGSTARAYATAFLEGTGPEDEPHLCDAVTLNPMLGSDSIQPFVEACARTGRGLYILVRTSNPSSAEFQAPGSPCLSERVADAVKQWGSELVGREGWSSVGAVVGATHPDELSALRARMPQTPLLLPGYGAQGAGARDVVAAFTGLDGALVNSSRGILFAGAKQPERDWREATLEAVETMATDLRGALGIS